ncbi:hypothetical protein M0R19_00830 [Candidatus Pacearchaeota archaeon]|jgi:hypothetical protein|nr:hypothetical protein [Candidatus Pacearchaeota archaeon]
MKKRMFSFLFLIAMIGFANAQGISDILSSFDESTLILYAVFAITFTILFFALQKTVFKGNNTPAVIIAGALALIATYSINKTGFDVGGFAIDLGIPEDFLLMLIPIILLGGIIFAIIKFKKEALWIVGSLLLAVGFFTYGGSVFIITGLILIGIRIVIMIKWGKKNPPIRAAGWHS